MWKKILLAVACSVLLAAAAPSKSARSAFDRAERSLAAGKLDAALAGYREALTRSPGYAAAINGIGSVYFKQGKRDEALAQFKAATIADPSFALGHFNLAFASRKAGDLRASLEAYERYTALAPADADGHLGLAETREALGLHAEAIAAYRVFLEKERRDSPRRAKASAAITALEQRGHAASDQPPAADPAATPAAGEALSRTRLAEGDAFMKDRKPRDAAFAYQDAVKAEPSSTEAHFKLGNAYAQLGYFPEALEHWSRVLALTPEAQVREAAEQNVARAKAMLGKSTSLASVEALGQASDSAKARARKAYEDGVGRVERGDYGGALRLLTEAVKLEPTLAIAFTARGSAHLGLRQFQEAATDYQFALRLDPSLASPLFGLAETSLAQGRPEEAASYYQRYASTQALDARPELKKQAREKAEKLR